MLNLKIILNIFGRLLLIEAIAMLFCIPPSLYYGDADVFPLLYSAGITAFFGLLLWTVFRKASFEIQKHDGYVIVGFIWVLFSAFGTLPYLLSGSIESVTNAFFEVMSGFTTTGATIINNVEQLPHGILLWRSMTQWLGGMGIIVLSLTILPLLGIGGVQLYAAEATGHTKDKIHPKVRETAKRLYLIYIIYTATQTFLLLIGGMSFFDAVNHSLTTMSSGGFSTKQDSIAHFQSSYIEYVIIIFMFIAGVNFSLSYFAVLFKFDKIYKNEEFRMYVFIILILTGVFTLLLTFSNQIAFEENFRKSLFQVVSLISTSGFTTGSFSSTIPLIGAFSFMLIIFGSTAGSTGGGMKIARVVIYAKHTYLELRRFIHPNAIIPVRLNKTVVPTALVTRILGFIVFYIIIFVVSVLVMTALGLDFEKAMGAVAASLGNVGVGIEIVSPDNSYNLIPNLGKWFLSFLMLIGRLELFTVLMLFSPTFWKT